MLRRRTLLQAGLIVSAAVLLGRVSGFVRELLLARAFGVSLEADIAVLLLTFPDLLIATLAGGAFGAALIPEFRRLSRVSPAAESALFVQASVLTAVGFTLASLGLIVMVRGLVVVLAPGFPADAVNTAERFVAIALWAVPLTALTMVTTAWLQSNGRFGVAASGTLLGNLLLIGALIGWPGSLAALALGVVAVGGARWGSQLLAMWWEGWRPRMVRTGWLISTGLARRYGEALGASGLVFLAPVVTRALASLWGEGGIASVNYAAKFVELPLGAFVGVISIVLFPRLADLTARQEPSAATAMARQGATAALALSVPIALALLVFGGPVAALVYDRGAMDAHAVAMVGLLTAAGALGIPAIGMAAVLQGLLNARGDTAAPLRVALMALPLHVAGGWAAVRTGGLPALVLVGVAIQWFALGALERQLRHRHDVSVLDWRFGRAAAAGGAIGLLAFTPAAAVGLAVGGRTAALLCAAAGSALSLGAMLAVGPFRRTFDFSRS